jgi:crotonobetainyl-CoA:carnitine CoA-transferase CaiB-like acyl-CoA transferase
MPDPRPFAGLEVVEFGQFIAVPYCGQLLADGGAHVIKVESLAGDPVRRLAPLAPGESRLFVCRNRGKHSLPLDLKHPSAVRVIDALVTRADVVLTNLRPGLAAELGLDATTLLARHPRLVVGNVTGFGPRGPDAGLAAMDLVIQARSGLMAASGRAADGIPIPPDPPIADYVCAMTLAFGIASALLRRAVTGRGGEVEVSLLMAALVPQNNAMIRVHEVDGPAHAGALEALARLRQAGAPYAEQVAVTPQYRTPAMSGVYYRTYATKDAAIAVACVSPGLQRALMRAVGMTDEAHEKPLGDPAAEARHYAALRARVEPVIASRATVEWKATFDAHGIPAAAVKIPLELLDDEQVLANGMLHDLAHPALGPVRVLSTPLRLDRDAFAPAPATPPFGSEARDILRALGFSEMEIDRFLTDGVTRGRYE